MQSELTRDLSDRIGQQTGVIVPTVLAGVGLSSAGPGITTGAVYCGDVENVRVQVVNETANPIATCKVQGCAGPADSPDAQWVDEQDLSPIPANDQKTAVVQGKGWRWMRLVAEEALGGTMTIRWSGR
jgi:hypothetical protein